MNKKCPGCGLVNFPSVPCCSRCNTSLVETENITASGRFLKSTLVRRLFVLAFAAAFALCGFYISLVVSAMPITYEQSRTVEAAIRVIEDRGFNREALFLKHLTVYRGNDNWLNGLIEKENAYAATNFPFEILTLYPDFFDFTVDDVERAAILLHESKHLQGGGEKEAYEFVWKNRAQLGWTSDKYARSIVWQNVRNQTREYAPGLFICDFNVYGDCTEIRDPLRVK